MSTASDNCSPPDPGHMENGAFYWQSAMCNSKPISAVTVKEKDALEICGAQFWLLRRCRLCLGLEERQGNDEDASLL